MIKIIELVINTKKVRRTTKRIVSITGNSIQFAYEFGNHVIIKMLEPETNEILCQWSIHKDDFNPDEVKDVLIHMTLTYYDSLKQEQHYGKLLKYHPLQEEQIVLVDMYRAMESALQGVKDKAKETDQHEEAAALKKLSYTLRNAKTMIDDIGRRTILADSETYPEDETVNRIVRGLKFIFKIKQTIEENPCQLLI